MDNPTFGQYWRRKCQTILGCSGMSLANQVLAYKTFLRPILIYEWFEGHYEYIKQLEIEALAMIFGTRNEEVIYKRFTDLDVTCYLKVHELKWRRATGGSTQEDAKRLMKSSFTSKSEPMPYFMRAFDKQKICNACGMGNTTIGARSGRSPQRGISKRKILKRK